MRYINLRFTLLYFTNRQMSDTASIVHNYGIHILYQLADVTVVYITQLTGKLIINCLTKTECGLETLANVILSEIFFIQFLITE